MDVITIAKKMYDRIIALSKARDQMESLAQMKAHTISSYERVLAITIIKLRNTEPVELEGKTILDPPVTIMERIARGVCYKEKLEMEKADAMYKAEITCMNALQAELNGLQSINKYLGEVVE